MLGVVALRPTPQEAQGSPHLVGERRGEGAICRCLPAWVPDVTCGRHGVKDSWPSSVLCAAAGNPAPPALRGLCCVLHPTQCLWPGLSGCGQATLVLVSGTRCPESHPPALALDPLLHVTTGGPGLLQVQLFPECGDHPEGPMESRLHTASRPDLTWSFYFLL